MSQEWENSISPNSKYQTPIYLNVVVNLPVPNSTYKVYNSLNYNINTKIVIFFYKKISTKKSFHLFNFKTDYEVHLNDFDLIMCGYTFKKDLFFFSINSRSCN
jgi:hypothetical protein